MGEPSKLENIRKLFELRRVIREGNISESPMNLIGIHGLWILKKGFFRILRGSRVYQ